VTVTVVLADDHALVRRELRRLVETQEDWQVCGEAKNGEEAIQLCDELRPDVVVLDVHMPLMNGLEAARRICKIAPSIGIVIVSADSQVLGSAAIEVGARACISKSKAADQLVPAIQALLEVDATYFPSEPPARL